MATAEVCRRHGISSATFYAWNSKYGGLDVSDAKRLKALEDENRKLKKLLAEQGPRQCHPQRDADKKLLTPAARRTAVSWAIKERDYSQRRACALIGLAPCAARLQPWLRDVTTYGVVNSSAPIRSSICRSPGLGSSRSAKETFRNCTSACRGRSARCASSSSVKRPGAVCAAVSRKVGPGAAIATAMMSLDPANPIRPASAASTRTRRRSSVAFSCFTGTALRHARLPRRSTAKVCPDPPAKRGALDHHDLQVVRGLYRGRPRDVPDFTEQRF